MRCASTEGTRLPTMLSYVLIKRYEQAGCSDVRASTEHHFIVRGLRAQERPPAYTFTPIFSAFAITSSIGPTM